jgi:putative oxidoreductase
MQSPAEQSISYFDILTVISFYPADQDALWREDRMSKAQGTGWREQLLTTRAPGWSILVRLLVGLVVFFPEGIQKLIFPDILGAGRFAHIGIPYPDIMGPFVGVVETVCGALIILGLFTRLAAIPLIVIMFVAIVSTKIPILLGQDFWIFHLPKLPRNGFWSMAHEARADFCMLLGSLYLLIEGGGRWSLDALLSKTPHGRA